MANHRLPKMKAEISGAEIKNPSRHKDRKSPKGTRPLGQPYKTMTDLEKWYWDEFAANCPWLHSSHRVLLRLACKLSATLEDGSLGINAVSNLSSVLSKLGATPVDETRVSFDSDEDENPEDRYFN